MTNSHQKLILEKVHGALIILFYVSPSSHPLQSHFKENAKILSINSTTQENVRISRLKEDCQTSNFKPEMKPMIENLQDELYQLENKQAKGAKLGVNIR